MSKLKSLLSVMVVLMFIVLIGCNTEEAESTDEQGETSSDIDGELRIAYPAQPPTFDPVVATAGATVDISIQVFETLLTLDSDYQIHPMLAESYEQSEDGKTITFYLREGVLFHNGKEMVAEDVVASMNRWKEGPGGKGQFTNATFKEEDDYTVVLELPEPLSTVISTLAHTVSGYAPIMPKEIVEEASEKGVDKYIGTGPFEFVEWKQDQHIHLARFEDYQSRSEEADGFSGKKEALVEDLMFVFTPDTSTMVAGLESGEYDIGYGVSYDDAELLKDNPDLVNSTFPNAYLFLHFNKKKGLFKDAEARRAIVPGLNMEDVLMAAFTNDTYYILNHNMMMYNQEEQWYSDIGKEEYSEYDPEKAKKLLQDAGYEGEELTLMTTRDYEEHYNASVVVQAQLEEIGVKINLEVYDWPTLVEKREDENEYDMYMNGEVLGPDPLSLRYLAKESGGWTDSPEFDKLSEEFRSQPSLEDTQSVYDDIQAWYWDYMPGVQFGDYDKVITARSTVENFQDQNKNHRLILWNVSNNK